MKEDIYDFYETLKYSLDKLEKKFSLAKWFDIYQRKKNLGFTVFRKHNLDQELRSKQDNTTSRNFILS